MCRFRLVRVGGSLSKLPCCDESELSDHNTKKLLMKLIKSQKHNTKEKSIGNGLLRKRESVSFYKENRI